mmetsp:Transcript_33829/g.61083  ORF Transcript_33829/g.61083 Transcript_33829/m.61083 type:complete len:203 (+) Transcript_33829:39-647(+)
MSLNKSIWSKVGPSYADIYSDAHKRKPEGPSPILSDNSTAAGISSEKNVPRGAGTFIYQKDWNMKDSDTFYSSTESKQRFQKMDNVKRISPIIRENTFPKPIGQDRPKRQENPHLQELYSIDRPKSLKPPASKPPILLNEFVKYSSTARESFMPKSIAAVRETPPSGKPALELNNYNIITGAPQLPGNNSSSWNLSDHRRHR